MGELDGYRAMARSRAFELMTARLWDQGLVSGELHLGTGEEAINAGIAAHLREDDAVALDHRGTPMMLMRGVDRRALLGELLGLDAGLCRGRGGHMHLFSKEHLAASSGIVGSAGPAAVGFGLAAKRLRPTTVAVAFFGDGAVNQGMLLESMNLAVAWRLPVLFVCKDNRWAIGTESAKVTGGHPAERAGAFGLRVQQVDGLELREVDAAAKRLLGWIRRHGRPGWLHAACSRLDGHLLGDPIRRVAAHPLGEGRHQVRRVVRGAVDPQGAPVRRRLLGLAGMMRTFRLVARDERERAHDPLVHARRAWNTRRTELEAIDTEAKEEVAALVESIFGGGAA